MQVSGLSDLEGLRVPLDDRVEDGHLELLEHLEILVVHERELLVDGGLDLGQSLLELGDLVEEHNRFTVTLTFTDGYLLQGFKSA